MKKLILIDGNSLLNRAFYAMRLFTTKDGLPTNGIFGFVKLLFKIIEDEKPEYFAVAFDLHAPTFRHKLYDGYKATRKPMPEELRVQVPVLKELLRAMKIAIVEKEGYEADDVLGTLSRAFPEMKVMIYTGDRDSYQLVRENVEICFTKRGVSDLERLNSENFYEKVGLYPFQIIEEKALMGDASDNIPGVRGIGPKCALELLKTHKTIDEIYSDITSLSPAVRKKLEEGRELAYLSRTLATIDTQVPLTVTPEDCVLTLPFSGEAREQFKKLEFISLLDGKYFLPAQAPVQTLTTVEVTDSEQFLKALEEAEEVALVYENGVLHVAFCNTEYLFRTKKNLLDSGFYEGEIATIAKTVLKSGKHVLVADYKAILHQLEETACEGRVEDVLLMRYLADSNNRTSDLKALTEEFSLPQEGAASALFFAYSAAIEHMAGTAEETLYRTLEFPLIEVLFDMETAGVRVDESKFPELSQKYSAELNSLSKRIYALAGESFNLNSPFQLSEVLFERLGYRVAGAKKNIRGGYSTNADVLEKLAEEHEIARLILRYREIQKLQSTYIDGIRPLIERGIVHTTYNQMNTTTGRLSSANPNLQNIPIRKDEGKELRKLFVAREGNVLIDADYSQIELRLLAHFSGCKPLMQAYNEGRDIHTATASQVFGVREEEVTPLMRRRAKAVNFGIIYGISAFGLAKDIGCSNSEAQSYIDRYFLTYSDVKEYMEENVRYARENGFVTTILGRKRYIPEIKSSNRNLRAFGERAAMNMPLQGSSADIIKLAMLGVFRRLQEEKLKSKLVLQVHDELILDAPLEEAERASALLKEEMERAVSLRVPLIAEVSTGSSWYDAK